MPSWRDRPFSGLDTCVLPSAALLWENFYLLFFCVCVPFPRLFQWILLDHNTPIQFKGLLGILLFFFRNFLAGERWKGEKEGVEETRLLLVLIS